MSTQAALKCEQPETGGILINILIYRRSSAESCQYRLSISLSLSLFGFDMDTFCVENGHICFLIPNASRGQRWFQTYISSLLLFFLLLSSDLLSVLQQVSFSKCAKQQIQILWWMLPAWLLNDPPAAMKALCNFKMHSLALHLACFSKTEVFCGQLWRRLRRVKHANWPGRRRFAESLGSFVRTRGGLTSAESNMHSGQDDEDLQKALAFW